MKNISALYDAIHMPQALENQIRTAVPARRLHFRPALALCVCFLMVCLLGCSPTIQAALGDMLVTVFPGLDLTVYQETTPEGSAVVCIDTEQSTFAYAENGRLYFTGNGENLDITDQITEETPYFYTYTQGSYEITLVVGYADSIENFGTYEFIQEDGAWFTGSGRNFLSHVDEGEAYPWVGIVWDTLDIPWPLPGT